MSKLRGNRTLTGTWGEIWVDGELIAELSKIEVKVSANREDVQLDIDVDSKMTGIKGEFTLTIKKAYTRYNKVLESWKKGVDLRSQIITKLADPDATNGQQERYSIDNCWYISVFKVLFNVVQTVFNGIASVISSVWDKVKPIVEGIGNGLSWIADKVGGLFGFGGGGGGDTGSNAEGTNNWRGGPTWVGEQGPELIDRPRGTRILPNKESVQLASSLQKTRAATAAQNTTPVPANAPIRQGGSSTPAASVIRLTLAKLADTIVVREEADIDKIGEKVAKEVVLAVKNMVPVPA